VNVCTLLMCVIVGSLFALSTLHGRTRVTRSNLINSSQNFSFDSKNILRKGIWTQNGEVTETCRKFLNKELAKKK
jgi:hypothetical protein